VQRRFSVSENERASALDRSFDFSDQVLDSVFESETRDEISLANLLKFEPEVQQDFRPD
jgi:hypothetical protein